MGPEYRAVLNRASQVAAADPYAFLDAGAASSATSTATYHQQITNGMLATALGEVCT